MSADQERQSSAALRQSDFMSRALSEAARHARLAGRRTPTMTSGGFKARRGHRIMRRLVWGSFVLLFVLPSLAAIGYYAFIASDQYVSETQFTIMGGEVQAQDGLGALTGIPAMAIVQDTQIVANYVHSRAAVEALSQMIDLRKHYSNPSIDAVARFDPAEPIEQLVKHWKRMSDVSIKMPSGIVEFKVRAFTPPEAKEIANSVLKISEKLINDLNTRMKLDIVRDSEIEFARAAERLTKARLELEKARNEEGILDTNRTGEALSKLITDVKGSIIGMQQSYNSMLRSVSDTAPQMRALKDRLDAAQRQLKELEALETSTGPVGSRTLSASMTKFSALDLERQIAERMYAGAGAALEIARMSAERQMMYLNTFVWPTEPQRALYPKRILYPALIVFGSLILWGLLVALAAFARNHMA